MATVQELLGKFAYQRFVTGTDERMIRSECVGRDRLLGGDSSRSIENVAVNSALYHADSGEAGTALAAAAGTLNRRFGNRKVVIQYLQFEEKIACWRMQLCVPDAEDFTWSLLFWNVKKLEASLDASIREIALRATMYGSPSDHVDPMIERNFMLQFHGVKIDQIAVSRDAGARRSVAHYSFTYGNDGANYRILGDSINSYQVLRLVDDAPIDAK